MSESEDLRKAALESLKRKRGFKQYLVVYLAVNVGMIAIWALAGPDRGSFWPGWVLFGTSIALVASAWNAYGSGNRPITDDQVDAEIRKLKGS